MDLVFEVGDSSAPAGHALVYFTSGGDDQIFATYVQTFPIPMNLAQYMPPVLSSLVATDQMDTNTATAMPPVAQFIEEGLAWLTALAQARRDDLVNAGAIYSTDQINLISMTQEAASHYADLYRARSEIEAPIPPRQLNPFADLTDSERLGELTKLVGRLRDNFGTPESAAIEADMRDLGASLPSKYRTDELLEWAAQPGALGQELATLHLQRSYKLLNEDYLAVAEIERKIKELQSR